jgi:hypothetical protein
MMGAAQSGSIAKVNWLYTEQDYRLPADVCGYSAESGNVNLLKWLKQEGQRFHIYTCNHAAEAGHEHVLEYLRAEGCEWNEDCFNAAVIAGHINVLQWLQEHGCPWSTVPMCNHAALSGSIPMMQYARQLGGTVGAGTMSCAASKGHLNMCKHLHSEQCPWDAEACADATRFGHLEVLRWLRAGDCPCDLNRVAEEAAAGGRLHILEYLHNEGLLDNAELLTDALKAAGAWHQLAVAQWLRQQGAQWPALLQAEGLEWRDELLAWARAEGCTAPTEEDAHN